MTAGLPIAEAWCIRLRAGIDSLGVHVDDAAQQRLLAFLALLVQWNAAYNLTAIRDPIAMIDRHLIDALSLLPYSSGADLADIGTGPGVPGMVLALVHPFERVWLVDSNGKKARFLRECLRRFDLPQVKVLEARAESLNAADFEQVVSRAYTDLTTFVISTRALIAPHGRWLAMKGKLPQAEIAALPAWVSVQAIHRLDVPFADGERHLVVMGLA